MDITNDPSITQLLIGLAGGVALLIWGLKRVQMGMNRAYGSKLAHLVRDRFAGVWSALGLGVTLTLILQSSTASALLAASLGVQGEAGLAFLLGADVGTTLVALILSFDLSALSPLLIALGVSLEFKGNNKRWQGAGQAAMGLGLMLLALGTLRAMAEPLQASQLFVDVMRSLLAEPWLALAFAAVITFMLHSSLVMVLLLAGIVAAQVIDVTSGLLLVLGVNIGSALIPVYMSRSGSNAKRVAPLGNLLLRCLGVMAFIPILDWLHSLFSSLQFSPAWQLVMMHCLFNLVVASFGMLIVSKLAGWIDYRLPPQKLTPIPAPKHLEDILDTSPAAAIANVVRDTLTMGDLLEDMLRDVHQGMYKSVESLEKKIQQSDDIIDDFHHEINAYLLELGGQELSNEERARCQDLLLFTTNIEHAGDILERSIILLLKKKNSLHIAFSEPEKAAIETCMQGLFDVMPLSFQVMMSEDTEAARDLFQAKQAFNHMHQQYLDSQRQKAMDQQVSPLAHNLFTDIMRDLKRLHSHFTAIAYPLLNRQGELHNSRWRGVEDSHLEKVEGPLDDIIEEV
ncbi:MAG: Na/Pi cotransporter family protein [Gammaproteobacteria bacterium]|nr:Na/Pi cotransporter family protein [Gammaproteobacteria bacterium]MCP4880718.1 Na/Pi cotransporter family protein [Gammaproteobacteria bacterium]MDP6165516.1 Na/Pi cotransporter family protein [Gammaproteobacteria bacterium]